MISWIRGLAVAGLSLVPPAPASARTSSPPNVLLLFVDGLGTAPLPPSVQALARHGRLFERAYLPHPLAGPSRAALFLGRRPERVGVWGEAEGRPRDAVTLPERFSAAAYAVARVGRATSEALDAEVKWDFALKPSAEADTSQRIAALLEERRSQPLFLVAGFEDLGLVPVPTAAADAAPRSSFQYPEIALQDLSFISQPGRRQAVPLLTKDQHQQAISLQQQRLRSFDLQLARILAVLDRRKLWESTIVALVATQAPPAGELLLPRADVLFEDRLRVPLVVAAPGMPKPGRESRAPVELTDVYATLLELAGLAAAEGSDSVSFAASLRDPATAGRTAVASVVRREAGGVGRSVRTVRWRYTEWPDGSEELYDHDSDPLEHTNLAGRAESASSVAEMKSLLATREQELVQEPSVSEPSEKPNPGRRPNVLFIVFDDLNVHLGSYGYPVKSPNIDRLARRGRRFERAYAQVPTCSPSRTSLLSGWRPERTGVWHNTDPPRQPGMLPLQEYFGGSGYFTAHVGKVWETAFDRDFRWDMAEYLPPTDDDAEAPPPGSRQQGEGPNWWIRTDNKDEDEPDGQRARRVVQILEQKRDRPFFVALGFAKPHLRWTAPRSYFDLYKAAQIDFVTAPEDDLADIPAISIKRRVERPGLPLAGREPPGLRPDPELRRKAIAAYYATVSFVDAQLGVVLDALDRLQLWESTVVVLIGDHGFHLGEHRGMWRKDTLFEEAVRVPLIISAPGLVDPGAPSPSVVELLDLYPTLVELAGLPAVTGIDGKSLVPLLKDASASVHSGAVSFRSVHSPTVAASIRSGKWRYSQWPDGSEELFDVDTDPEQRENLAARPEHAATVAELRLRRAQLVP